MSDAVDRFETDNPAGTKDQIMGRKGVIWEGYAELGSEAASRPSRRDRTSV